MLLQNTTSHIHTFHKVDNDDGNDDADHDVIDDDDDDNDHDDDDDDEHKCLQVLQSVSTPLTFPESIINVISTITCATRRFTTTTP